MTTLIGWPTTPHTDVKATSFWCHFLLSFLHLMRYKTKMINFSLFVWLKNLKSKIYPFINFLKKQFTLDTPKVKLLWNLFQILCHHPCWIICLKSVALHTIFMAFVFGMDTCSFHTAKFDQCHLLVMISKFMLVFKFNYLS